MALVWKVSRFLARRLEDRVVDRWAEGVRRTGFLMSAVVDAVVLVVVRGREESFLRRSWRREKQGKRWWRTELNIAGNVVKIKGVDCTL
jgi:hypothetical protein